MATSPAMGMWLKFQQTGHNLCAKSNQGELQLNRSQLCYLEHLGPVQQEAIQPKITKRPPQTYHIKNKCLHHEKPKNNHMIVLCLIKFYKI